MTAGSQARRYALGGVSVALVVCLAFAAGFVRDFSGDFHWHVVQGAWMLDHHQLLRSDVFSWTVRGQREFSDAWLSDIALAVAYRGGGYAGCYALRGAALAIAAAVLMREMVRAGTGAAVAAVAFSLVIGELLFRLYLRPETLTLPLLAGILALLGEHERGGGRKLLAWTLPTISLWANVHASVLIGLMAIGLYGLERAVRASLGPREGRGAELFLGLGLPIAAGFAATLNPHGIREPLMFLYVRGDDPTFHAGVEWLPLSLDTMTLVFPAMGVCVLASTLVAARRASAWRVALSAALFTLTLLHGRFVKVFLLASLPLFATNIVAIRSVVRRLPRSRWWIRAGMGLTAAAALGSGVLLFGERKIQREVGIGLDPGVYPEAACRFASSAPLHGNMLNSFNIGSYLMFCLPEHPVFIDQRAAELYTPEFSRAYYAARDSPAKVHAYADAMGVDWAFVIYDDLYTAAIAADPATWRLYYFDDQALVYVKSTGADAALAPDGYQWLDPVHPWALPFLEGASLDLARHELEQQVVRCSDCAVTRLASASLALARHDLPTFDLEAARAPVPRPTSWALASTLEALSRGRLADATRLLQELALQMPHAEWMAVVAQAFAWSGDLASADEALAAQDERGSPRARAARAYVERARSRH